MKRIAQIVALLYMTVVYGYAAPTVVTGTITGADGLAYANGTISVVLTNAAGVSYDKLPYNAQTANIPIQSFSSPLDSTGSFSITLAPNSLVTGSFWTFTGCNGGNTPACFTYLATISGASQSLTTPLTAAAVAALSPSSYATVAYVNGHGGSGGLADPGSNGLVYRSALNVTRPGVIGDVPTGYPYANLSGAPATAAPFSLLNGGWSNWVDPKQCDAIHMYCAAGSIATTTGSITTGTNLLTVVSSTGWTVGMGISVAGAISGAHTELGGEDNPLVSVTAINGLVFTLSASASNTVAGATVNHEDSGAIVAALTSGFNVHLFRGNYNVTSRSVGQDILQVSTPIMFIGDGAGIATLYKRSISGAIIRIGHSTFGFGNEGSVVSDIGIGMGSGFTPTDGPAVYVASLGGAGTYVNSAHVERMLIIGTCGGFYTGLGVNVVWFRDSRIYSIPSGCSASGGIKVNTASPGGDINFDGNQLSGLSTGINITSADTNEFSNNKLNGGTITFNPASDGVVIRQRFINTSVEGQPGSATCGVTFINHTSDQMEFIGGGIGLNFTNGICTSAQTTGFRVIGMHFYGLGGYGLSLGGGSTTSINSNEFASTSGAINLFGSSSAAISGNTALFGSGTFLNTSAAANKISVGANNTTLTNTIGAGTICSTCFTDQVFTVATLPACNAGLTKSLTTVSDATAPTYNGALTGGGTVQVPAYCNGTAWLSH